MFYECRVFLPPAEEGGEPVVVHGYEQVSGDVVVGYVDTNNQPFAVPPGCSIEYLDRKGVEDPWAPPAPPEG